MIPIKTYPLPAIMGNELTDKERIAKLEAQLKHCEGHAAELEARLAESERDADIAIVMLAEWSFAVSNNGTGWDDWDEHFKDAAYRDGPLRGRIDAEVSKLWTRLDNNRRKGERRVQESVINGRRTGTDRRQPK
jgi:hypothetical protein